MTAKKGKSRRRTRKVERQQDSFAFNELGDTAAGSSVVRSDRDSPNGKQIVNGKNGSRIELDFSHNAHRPSCGKCALMRNFDWSWKNMPLRQLSSFLDEIQRDAPLTISGDKVEEQVGAIVCKSDRDKVREAVLKLASQASVEVTSEIRLVREPAAKSDESSTDQGTLRLVQHVEPSHIEGLITLVEDAGASDADNDGTSGGEDGCPTELSEKELMFPTEGTLHEIG
eukprot:CAMPEP_0185753764 /NCGR_PEP_ID=MMETSP1174-20130828/12474_1 /TAXON_ID=35687 /ORGANISM="Dictyocha speculum, Strain CCMP1381" /LENGTH=226 /DNA_ID=CAMNT_0028431747 /DNA_START=10 /DNA_END=686 /DNA_ORIENTATION=+